MSESDERTLSSGTDWEPYDDVRFTCVGPPIIESGLRIFLLRVCHNTGTRESAEDTRVELWFRIVDALTPATFPARH